MTTQVAMVEWLDACTEGEWLKPDEVADRVGPTMTQSAGFLVRDDDEMVVLAQTMNALPNICDFIAIPRAMVRKITKYGRTTR